MSDLPPPTQSLRVALAIHALVAVAILLIAELSGGHVGKAFAVSAAYFVLAGGWSWFRSRRAAAAAAASEARARGEGHDA